MAFDFTSLPQAVGNTLGAAAQKLQEAASKTVASIGGVGSFTKVTADGGNIAAGAAEVQRFQAAAIQANATSTQTQAAITDVASTVDGGKSLNAMTFSAAKDSQAANVSQVSATSMNAQIGVTQDDSHIVKLTEPGTQNIVKFEVMPDVSENRTVEYEAVQPPQSPAAFQKYKGTGSVQWSITATLTSRTTDEATRNLRLINQLRAWTMPYFGERTAVDYPQKLGAPPPVLILSGYRAQMIGPIPVIITSLSWPFTPDVDYIPAREEIRDPTAQGSIVATGTLVPFPTVLKVSIQMLETFSTDQMNGFSLADFRLGQFASAWASLPGQGTSLRSDGSITSGGAETPEDAQEVARNQARRMSVVAPGGGNAGRGSQGGPTAEQLAAVSKKVARAQPPALAAGAPNFGVPITEIRGPSPEAVKPGGGFTYVAPDTSSLTPPG